MARLLVHVEGQTEEAFVNRMLAPHLYTLGYASVTARLLGNARQRSRRGGIRAWNAVRKDILNHLRQDQNALSTTMVDYYRLPKTWPGREEAPHQLALSDRAASVQQAILEDVSTAIGHPPRFVPYVVMHEFEGLLFSDPGKFAQSLGRSDLAPPFQAIRNGFQTPEDINDSPDTAPSKRVCKLYPGYQKPLMGVPALQKIGLDVVRQACPLFNRWLRALEQHAAL